MVPFPTIPPYKCANIELVPIILAIGGFWLNRLQRSREEKTIKQRAEDEQKIATDNQREAALQAYISNISELLLHEKLHESKPEDEARNIARVRTLTVLPRLDAIRKKSVLQFLYESGLIDKSNPIVKLDGADFRQADLKWIKLENAYLNGAFGTQADLSGAKLSGANFRGASFREANFSKAILNGALMDSTKLRGADLSEADLKGAIMGMTVVQLEKIAKSLQGTIMPDGSIHP